MDSRVPSTNSHAMRRILCALCALERKPSMSVSDLSAEAFVGVTTLACGGYIKALKKKRLIYISGWRQVHGRFSTPLYSMGDFPDVVRPVVDDTNRDAPGMGRILETLETYGPLTYKQIAEFSGLSRNTVKNSGYLSALLVQRKIHVCGWRRSQSGPMLAIYRAGTGCSVPKPESFSSTEKSLRHRQRKKLAKSLQNPWQVACRNAAEV